MGSFLKKSRTSVKILIIPFSAKYLRGIQRDRRPKYDPFLFEPICSAILQAAKTVAVEAAKFFIIEII